MYKSEQSYISLFQFFISCFCLFFLFKLIASGIISQDQLQRPDINKNIFLVTYSILVVLLASSACLTYKHFSDLFTIKTKQHRIYYFISFVLFTLLFIYSNYVSNFFELWGDEVHQINTSALNPITGSSSHHQVPIGYLLSHISFQFFGVSDYSARFTSMTMHSLAFLTLFFYIQTLCKNYFVSILFVFLCLGNYYIFNYSFEGRSQSTALFFLACFLFAHHKYVFTKVYSLKLNFSLYVCCTLLILTVAFQPPFLLLSIGLLTPFFFAKYFCLKKAILYFCTFLLSVLTASPFIYLNTVSNVSKLKDITFHNIFFQDFINFKFINFEHLKVFDNLSFLSANKSLLVYTILLIFILSISGKYKLKGYNSIKLSIFFYLVFISSSLFSFNFFQHHVIWYFSPKYIYLMIVMFYLSLAFAIHSLIRPILNHYKELKLILVVCSIIISALVGLNSTTLIKELSLGWNRYDTKSAYLFTKNNLPENSPIYCLFLRTNVHNCYDIEVYNDFLQLDKTNNFLNLFMFELNFDLENYKKIPNGISHFAIMIKGSEKYLRELNIELNFNKKNIIAIKRFRQSLIYIFKNDYNIKNLIYENLSIIEKGIYNKNGYQSNNFSNYIKKIQP